MRKQKTAISPVSVAVLAALTAIALFNVAAFAQANEPAKIEIKSLMIRKIFQRTPEGFLTYRTMQGADVTFAGRASQVRLPYMDSSSFPFPASLTTVLSEFDRIYESKSSGETFLPHVRFYIDSMESEPINLRPTILRKRDEITVTGKVRMRGKAEIYEERIPGVPWLPVAADDDFDLVGTYTASFRQFAARDRRAVLFQFITYNLTQAQ
ncbi:MAG: hypothetical protein M3384_04350 [Acidobacteriota bacterium]|nr:hypothetical protein [Acidobacteriota bacterium]